MKARRIFALLLLAFSPVAVFACKCVAPPSDPQLTRRAWVESRLRDGVVFEGQVEQLQVTGLSLDPVVGDPVQEPRVVATFSGIRVYRGTSRERVQIETGLGFGDCGFPFEMGKRYLVHAWDENGHLATGICAETGLLEDSQTALRFLRGEPPAAEDLAPLHSEQSPQDDSQRPDNICGKVLFPPQRSREPISLFFWRLRPHFPIALVADDQMESKPNGSFCVNSLEPGRYAVTAEEQVSQNYRDFGFYEDAQRSDKPALIEVKEGDTVLNIVFPVYRQRLYSVRGHVLRPADHPEKGAPAQVVLRNVHLNGLPIFASATDEVAPDGSFKLAGVPPGRYLIFAVVEDEDAKLFTFVSQKLEIEVDSNVSGLVLNLSGKK